MKSIQKLKATCMACFVLLLFFAGTEKGRNSNNEKPFIKNEDSSPVDLKERAALLYDTFTIEGEYAGQYYLHAKVPLGGFLEWYIVKNASTYTKIGETNNNAPWPTVSEIYFYFDKPAVPGNYRMWAEGAEGASFTIEIVLGN